MILRVEERMPSMIDVSHVIEHAMLPYCKAKRPLVKEAFTAEAQSFRRVFAEELFSVQPLWTLCLCGE